MRKTITLGIDALDYNLLNRWKDELPNFRKLMEKGVHGVLESTIPPITIPAWPSMFTGKKEGKIGALYFKEFNEDMELVPTKPTWMEDAFWLKMEKEGIKSCIYEVPGSIPNGAKKSLVVSGFPYSGKTNSKEKWREIKEEGTKELGPGLSIKKENFKKNIRTIKKTIWEDEFDFYFLALRYLDTRLHHLNSLRKLKKVYKEVDKSLGDLMDTISKKGFNLIITSDHGGRKYSKVFYMNTWLKRKGYLKFKEEKKGEKMVLKIADFLMKIGLKNLVKKVRSYFKKLSNFGGNVFQKIDFENSKAFSFPPVSNNYSGIFILGNNKTEIKEKIKKELPKEIERVYEKKEIYGEDTKGVPDLIVRGRKNVSFSVRNIPNVVTKRKVFNHTPEGTFIAVGKDFKKNTQIKREKIWNIAPLILFLYGCPIPDNLEGEIKREIFREDSKLKERKAKKVKPSFYQDDLKEVEI